MDAEDFHSDHYIFRASITLPREQSKELLLFPLDETKKARLVFLGLELLLIHLTLQLVQLNQGCLLVSSVVLLVEASGREESAREILHW